MKYQHLLVIFLILMIFVAQTWESHKPSKKGKKGKKGKNKKGLSKKKKYFPRRLKHTFERRMDLDVMIRFAFARYSSSPVANFLTGVFQTIYLPMFRRLKQVENTRKLVKNHLNCVRSTLHPFMTSQRQGLKFVNRFMKGINASRRTFMNQKIFNYSLKKWFSSSKTVSKSNKLIRLRFRSLNKIKNIKRMRNILGKGVWLNVFNHSRYLIKFFKTAWFNSSFFTKKVLRCAIDASRGFSSFRRYFIIQYKKTKRSLCSMNPVNILVRVLRDYRLLAALRGMFKQVIFKGIRLNKIHHINWTRIGRSVLVAYLNLLNECPI